MQKSEKSMANKQEEKRVNAIITDLYSKDSRKVSKAIKALEVHGNSKVIKAIADCLLGDVDTHNEAEMLELLSSLKDTSVVVEMMEVVCDPIYLPIRQKMLTTIWNTKVDFSDYIDEFVEIAVQGDFMETLECLTIIENLEGPFMEESILECQLHLKNYLESNTPRDEQKSQLLSEIALKIKEINQELMD